MTTALEYPPAIVQRNPRELISPQLWQRLTARITKDHPEITPDLADRITDQTLIFLYLCAIEPGQGHAPSRTVDIGWHTFILHTRDYTDFCQRTAGRYLHHNPTDTPGATHPTGIHAATLAALHAHHLPVDETLWTCATADCDGPKCKQCECDEPATPNNP